MIVIQGLGLDVDSTSSIVAFGLTLESGAPLPPSVEAVSALGIEAAYAIDYGRRKKRKLTCAEYRRMLRLYGSVLQRSHCKIIADRRTNRYQQERFAKGLRAP